jgi:hypothetical protein
MDSVFSFPLQPPGRKPNSEIRRKLMEGARDGTFDVRP